MLLQLQPPHYLPVDKQGICTRVEQCQRSEVYGGVAHGYEALTIGTVDISSTTVAGQVSDDTGETGRTFVFVEIDMSTTSTTATIPMIIVSL